MHAQSQFSSSPDRSFEASLFLATAEVNKIEQDFVHEYGVELDLSKSDHFLSLARIADFDSLCEATADSGGRLLFKRYDIALLLLKEFLKRSTNLQLHPDYNNDYIEAVFPKLFVWPVDQDKNQDYKRRLKCFDDLGWSYQEHVLDLCFTKIQEACQEVVGARDKVEHDKLYSPAFLDAFHNIFVNNPPFIYDFAKGKTVSTHSEFIAMLKQHSEIYAPK